MSQSKKKRRQWSPKDNTVLFRLVIDKQNVGVGAPLDGRRLPPQFGFGAGFGNEREVHSECGPAPLLGVDADGPLVVFDRTVDRCQTHSRAAALILGGEKRLEYALLGLLVHTTATVAH